jgi:hypothetical protein
MAGCNCPGCIEVRQAEQQAELDRINAGRYEKLKTWLVSKQEGRWIRIGSHYFEKSGSSFDSAVDTLDVPDALEG